MDRLTCTVVIPTFNRARYIGEAIESILGQTRKPDEVIVVDDGSTDETRSVLKNYSGSIKVIGKPNGGKASAVNLAVQHVKGQCVWVFDDDDVALPDALERHLTALERTPTAGFTYSPMLVGHSTDDGRLVPGHEVALPPVEADEFFIRLMEESFVEGQPAVVMRTECLIGIGLFDERLVRSQDYDLILRLARKYVPARIERPTFIQRRHTGIRGTSTQAYSGSDRHAQWSKYNRIFMLELLRDLPLTSYIRQRADFDECQALIQRFVIATRHGILDQAEQDLRRIISFKKDLTVEQRHLIARSLTFFTALREVGVQPCLRIAGLCRGRVGRQIRVNMAKGLFHNILGFARQRRFSEAGHLIPRTVTLVGLSGAVELFAEKFFHGYWNRRRLI